MKIAVNLLFLATLLVAAACEGAMEKKYRGARAVNAPASFADHTFFRFHGDRQFVEYFAPGGEAYLWHSGMLKPETARWIERGDTICVIRNQGSDCVDQKEWARTIISAYRSDYLDLGTRSHAPCFLTEGEYLPNFSLAYFRQELTEYDTDTHAGVRCSIKIENLFRYQFAKTDRYFFAANASGFNYCIQPVSRYVAADGLVDVTAVETCFSQVLTDEGVKTAVDYARFYASHADRSIRSEN